MSAEDRAQLETIVEALRRENAELILAYNEIGAAWDRENELRHDAEDELEIANASLRQQEESKVAYLVCTTGFYPVSLFRDKDAAEALVKSKPAVYRIKELELK